MLDRDRTAGKLVCDCGGVIPRPLPANCPHCGARIVGVDRRANWAPPVIVALLFGVLLAFLWALQRWWLD
jgi:hypothetical protein